MKRGLVIGIIVMVVIGLTIALVTAYDAGRDAADSAIDCEAGKVLSLETAESVTDAGRTIDRTLNVGNCDRIGEDAFDTAVNALASSPSDTGGACVPTTSVPSASTTTPTTVAPAAATAVPPTTAPCPSEKP